jgi:aspartyl-tRNA(Asn)/glutamyl-tRNA(Gln) amidotransferase subunit C
MDRDQVIHVARLARLRLEEAEITSLAKQLSQIFSHFEKVSALPTEGVEPAIYAVDVTGPTRADEPAPSADRDALLANTPHGRDGLYVVPPVLE